MTSSSATPSELSRRQSVEEAGQSNLNLPSNSNFDRSKERLKVTLEGIEDRFVGFEKILEDGSQRRKTNDDQKYQELRERIIHLEKALNVEIKRRVEANTQLQQATERMANEMLTRTQNKLFKKIEKLVTSFESLVRRCEALETSIQQSRGEVPTKIETDCLALKRTVSELWEVFQSRSRQDVDKEKQLNARIGEIEKATSLKLENERQAKAENLETLKRSLERFSRCDETTKVEFKEFIVSELNSLRSTLKMISETREQADDEIVEGINEYAAALEKAARGVVL